MAAPLITSQTFNEGIGHGGFYSQVFSNGSAIGGGQWYVFQPFSVTDDAGKIVFTDPIGGAVAKAGVLRDKDASTTVQIPVTVSNGVATPIALIQAGMVITDQFNTNWWVERSSQEYSEGAVWKQALTLTKKLTSGLS